MAKPKKYITKYNILHIIYLNDSSNHRETIKE